MGAHRATAISAGVAMIGVGSTDRAGLITRDARVAREGGPPPPPPPYKGALDADEVLVEGPERSPTTT